jgi:hypothetical protein
MASDTQPADGAVSPPAAPSVPQFERPKPAKRGSSPNPLAVIGGALVAGYVLAKAIDWRGHAHPRR